jgi:hypothetical protein
MMEIERITPVALHRVRNQEVRGLHHRLHQLAGRAEGPDKERYWNAHQFVRDELARRGLAHHVHDWLDKPWTVTGGHIPSLLVVPEYLCAIGSFVNPTRSRINDIDLLFRDTKSRGWEQNISEGYPAAAPPLHYVYNPLGPISLYVPLADLVLSCEERAFANLVVTSNLRVESQTLFWGVVASGTLFLRNDLKAIGGPSLDVQARELGMGVEWVAPPLPSGESVYLTLRPRGRLVARDILLEAKLEQLSESITPGRQFQPMKSRAGYHKGEFYALDDLWDFWASGIIGKGVAVEAKYDGYRLSAHRKGEAVKLFTEDATRDVASRLPKLVAELKSLPGGDFVLDGELCILTAEGKASPQAALGDGIFGSAPDDVNYIYHVFDCLYADGQPLDEEPWSQRLRVLGCFV